MNEHLVGKTYTFEDGNFITVIQIKSRDEGLKLVTYEIGGGGSLPRKLVMTLTEFEHVYGYLFDESKPVPKNPLR
jgi:hypothetical protein